MQQADSGANWLEVFLSCK